MTDITSISGANLRKQSIVEPFLVNILTIISTVSISIPKNKTFVERPAVLSCASMYKNFAFYKEIHMNPINQGKGKRPNIEKCFL